MLENKGTVIYKQNKEKKKKCGTEGVHQPLLVIPTNTP